MQMNSYPDLGAPLLQWAWEFLRRNDDYKFDFEQSKNMGMEERYSEDGRFVQSINTAGVLATEKWGLMRGGYLPDPDDADAWQKDDFEIEGHIQRAYGARNSWTNAPIETIMHTARNPNEFAVIFDLTKPIEEQIKAAKRQLLFMQQDGVRKGLFPEYKARARRPADLLKYLQVWDAKTRGDSWATIRRDLNYQYIEGARADLEAANTLIEVGYRTLRLAPDK